MANETRTILPRTAHNHTCILLHGRGSTAQDFELFELQSRTSDNRTLPQIFPSIKWILPSAPMIKCAEANGEISQWFDMPTTNDAHQRNQPDDYDRQLREAIDVISTIVDEEIAAIGESKIFLGGISQGGAVALHFLLSRSDLQLAGYLGISTWLPKSERPAKLGRVTRTPVYLAHAEDDSVINIKYGREVWARLMSAGFKVDWHVSKYGGHCVDEPKGVESMAAFVRRNM